MRLILLLLSFALFGQTCPTMHTKADSVVACKLRVKNATSGILKTNSNGNVSVATAGTDFVTGSSTNTFTNKSGNISQWTNDAGYTNTSGVLSTIGALGDGVLYNESGTTGVLTTTGTGSVVLQDSPEIPFPKITSIVDASNTAIDIDNRGYTYANDGNVGLSMASSTDGIGIKSTGIPYAYLKTSNLTADRIYQFPDIAGSLTTTGNNLSVFSSTTSAQLAGVLSNETGSGSAVFGTSPTISAASLTGTNSIVGKLNLTPSAVDNVEGGSGNTTTRLTLSTYQQSNQTGGYGDLVRMIAEHGSAKGGIKWFTRGNSAQVITTNSEPYNVTTGQTLTLKINGSATRTVTFNTSLSGTSFTSGAATADQISDIICKSINYTAYPSGLVDAAYYGQASTYLTQSGLTVNQDALKVIINSCTYGASSTIEITGGTALTGLGLSIGTYTGSAGNVTFDDATTARQTAWIVSHDYPNNPASNNPHKHISFEVPDSSGEMQTRLGITYGKNVSEITTNSAIFIVNGYPITIANSANSFKDVDFSRDNTGRQISRVAQIRTDSDANGGNVLHRVFDNSGTATTLLTLNRLSKYVALGGALQEKIRTTANTAQSVMTLSPQNGNSFKLSGTGTVNYVANTDWQAGSQIVIVLQGAATLTHNAGSPTGTNRPLKLSGSTNYTAGANGSAHTFMYDGTGYENVWIEISRIAF